MHYKEFVDTISDLEQEYELTELVYFGAIERLKDVQKDVSRLDDVKHVQRVMKLFLICWGMNRVVRRKGVDWKRLADSIRKLEPEFTVLRNKRFLTPRLFEDKAVFDAIKKIYGELDSIPYLGSPTTLSKILHLLNPEIFVMWDNAIEREYHKLNRHIDYSANGYLEFLKDAQKGFLLILSEYHRETGKTIDVIEQELKSQHQNRTMTRLIDEYNWVTAKR
ncbi:MAG: hypothetical protein ABR909_02740 [Candidatus Bathyarchaeia archaeon]|jgi:hypothetical protein